MLADNRRGSDSGRSHDAGDRREVQRVTWVGLVTNLVLSALKLVGGIVGQSQAVVADAVHSLSDITTDVAILVGVRYWSKPADANHPHGHRRLESLVTLGIGLVLVVVAAGLLWNAIVTLEDRHESPPEWIAFAAALLSIVSKEILYRWTLAAGQRIKSLALIANAWHHRSDALSSIPAALAVAGAVIHPAWAFLDHVGAAVVSLFIFQAAYRIIRPEFAKLIDSGAPEAALERIRRIALETEGVRRVHRIRTRYVGGTSLAVDLHVKVDPEIPVREGHDISEEVKRQLLENGPEVVDVVVHLEPCEGPGAEVQT